MIRHFKFLSELLLIGMVFAAISCKSNLEQADTEAPGCVKNLTAVSEAGKIVLTWEDPDDEDLYGIKIYNGITAVSRSAVSLSDGVLIGKGIEKYEIGNLEDGVGYCFRVSAVDNALNESRLVSSKKVIFQKEVTTVEVEKVVEKEVEKTVETVVEKTKYVCPNCQKQYDTVEEAAECCGVQTVTVEKVVEKEVKTTKYVCPTCSKEYDTAEEAKNCCGVQTVEVTTTKYVCPGCSAEYDTAEEAKNCCGVQTVEVEKIVEKEVKITKYVCPTCSKEYDTAEEAKNCCGVQTVEVEKIVETKKYVCPTCLKEYDTVTEAAECCLTNKNWLNSQVPGLYDTYKDIFEYIGIAAEYGNFGLKKTGSNKYTAAYSANGYWGTPSELYYEEIQKGIAKHANSITLGNELKPQFLLQWWDEDGSSQTMVDFTASNGKTIKVPSALNGENLIYATLNAAKAMNVKMRGHVLTWHSQTPDGFFAEDYKPTYDGDLISNLVDAETMTARHEWYIKTVLECVANWEAANGFGEGNHLIWAWDVVNEAMADDAGNTYSGDSQKWLRGSTSGTKDKKPGNGGSRWYQVYGNEDFIVNAFRFANAYAPEDVKLCYNDYNEYWDASGHYKTSAICHIAETIKNGEAQTINGETVSPRLDVIAMQSHLGTSWPGVTTYENALKRFLEIADVHVSELDFSAETQEAAVNAYTDYFTMFKKYGKNYSGNHKITSITIWGINNENSWINPSSSGGKKTYPLLFNLEDNVSTSKKSVTYDTGTEELPLYDLGDSYKTNDSFWAVINAAQ